MDIKDVKLYDTVRIKPDKCLDEHERRLIFAVTQIDVDRKIVSLSSLNHKVYLKNSLPYTPRIDVADIAKIANTPNDPLYDYIMSGEYKQNNKTQEKKHEI